MNPEKEETTRELLARLARELGPYSEHIAQGIPDDSSEDDILEEWIRQDEEESDV